MKCSSPGTGKLVSLIMDLELKKTVLCLLMGTGLTDHVLLLTIGSVKEFSSEMYAHDAKYVDKLYFHALATLLLKG